MPSCSLRVAGLPHAGKCPAPAGRGCEQPHSGWPFLYLETGLRLKQKQVSLSEGLKELQFHLLLGTGQCKYSKMRLYLLTIFCSTLECFLFSFPSFFLL